MDKILKSKIALITGAGRGIGAATAKLFSEVGAKTLLISRSEAELKETQKTLSEESEIFVCDLEKEQNILNLMSQIQKKYSALDILVNNAGYFDKADFKKFSTEIFDKVLNINLRAPFILSREVSKIMKKGATIVNVSSVAGLRGVKKYPGFSAYTASKAGIIGLTQNMAQDLFLDGIRVNCVAPGPVNTQMLQKAVPGIKTETEPIDVAEVILFLASEKSKLLTGSIVEVVSNT
jgi:NAD(P)-dependent dehydrogenase (short-subunit alcohol dehydrogenase family)